MVKNLTSGIQSTWIQVPALPPYWSCDLGWIAKVLQVLIPSSIQRSMKIALLHGFGGRNNEAMHSKGFSLSKFSTNMGLCSHLYFTLAPPLGRLDVKPPLISCCQREWKRENSDHAGDQMALGVAVFTGLGSSFHSFSQEFPNPALNDLSKTKTRSIWRQLRSFYPEHLGSPSAFGKPFALKSLTAVQGQDEWGEAAPAAPHLIAALKCPSSHTMLEPNLQGLPQAPRVLLVVWSLPLKICPWGQLDIWLVGVRETCPGWYCSGLLS